MSRQCEITGKKVSYGHRKQHARGASGGGGVWRMKAPKTNRTWIPNLRKIKALKNGQIVTVKVSMKAYKALKKNGSLNGYQLAK